MHAFRSRRPTDEHTVALVQARLTQLAGRDLPNHYRHDDNRYQIAPSQEGYDGDGQEGRDRDGQEGYDRDGQEGRDRDRAHAAVLPAGGRHRARPGHLSPPDNGTPARSPLIVHRIRLGLERGHVAVIALLVGLAVTFAVILFGLGRPKLVPVGADGHPQVTASRTPQSAVTELTGARPSDGTESQPDLHQDGESQPAASASSNGDRKILVDVAGLVARPGVVELMPGARVVDAIEAAGGATKDADLTPINLARILSDGEQVMVTADPPPATAQPTAPSGAASGVDTNGLVNLNTATADELDQLPGIGPALAERICQWRDQNGGFSAVDELQEVSGIGEQRFAELQPLVTV